MNRLLLATTVMLASLLWALAPQRAFACTCAFPGSSELGERVYNDSVAIVVAELDPGSLVEEYKTVLGDNGITYGSRLVRARAETALVYKGSVPQRFEVTTAGDGVACGYESIREGGHHLMFLHKTRDGGYGTGLCTAFPINYDVDSGKVSSSVPHQQGVIENLAKRGPPPRAPGSDSFLPPATGLILIGVVLLGGALVVLQFANAYRRGT